jgi:hypothetical protein
MLLLKKKLMIELGYDKDAETISDDDILKRGYVIAHIKQSADAEGIEYNQIPDEMIIEAMKIEEYDGTIDEIREAVISDKQIMDNYGNIICTDSDMRPVALPYIISGNISDHINTRVIRNIKFTEKVENSYTFQKLQEDNHKYLNYIKPNYGMQLISSLINTKFTYVEYDHPELLNQEITYSDDKISDEILFFLASI